MQKTEQTDFRIKKLIKFKCKDHDELFNDYINNNYIPQKNVNSLLPFSCFGENRKVELDIFDYATKSGVKETNTL